MCFFEFCEPLQPIIELMKGLWESLLYSQVVEVQKTIWDLQRHLQVGAVW